MNAIFQFVIQALAGLLGVALALFTILSAVRTFVLPRSDNVWLTRQVFRMVYQVFQLHAKRATSYEDRDRALAFFGPVVLLLLPIVMLGLLIIAFTPVYWGLGVNNLYDALLISGSSLLTLGYASVAQYGLIVTIVSFLGAALGMIMVALLIAYLPTIYSAFSHREKQVAMLEVRAGSPPWGVTMLQRVFRNQGDTSFLVQTWEEWEGWFAEIEESHTSLVVLCFFRSPQPDRSWITAAGAVLDAAVLLESAVDRPREFKSVLMIRAGYIALRKIADFFRISYHANPEPGDPISITRQEFDEACELLAADGVPLRADRDEAWRDFSGWRVNYDEVLISLAHLVAAPYAPWSSDRSVIVWTQEER